MDLFQSVWRCTSSGDTVLAGAAAAPGTAGRAGVGGAAEDAWEYKSPIRTMIIALKRGIFMRPPHKENETSVSKERPAAGFCRDDSRWNLVAAGTPSRSPPPE